MSEQYIFALSEKVDREHVFYNNRYGIRLAGDLYTARDMDKGVKYPAIVVGPPYAGTKEQGPGVYANELARRGFVVLTFDPAYMGESDGEPRHVSSPDIFAENFSAGVDYLGCLPFVDREKIGAIGICGSGGFSLAAAAIDTRIKAVVTASMMDMSAMRNGMTKEQLLETKKQLNEQRWKDFESGNAEWIPTFPETPADKVPDGLDPMSAEFFTFYGMKRGHHPNAQGNFTTTSNLAMMNYPLLTYIKEISPRPIMAVVGADALSKGFSMAIYESAAEPKTLVEVPNCNHVDLYDDVTKIPFDRIEKFLKENLK